MRMGLVVLCLASLLFSAGCNKKKSVSPEKNTPTPVVQDMDIQKPGDQ